MGGEHGLACLVRDDVFPAWISGKVVFSKSVWAGQVGEAGADAEEGGLIGDLLLRVCDGWYGLRFGSVIRYHTL